MRTMVENFDRQGVKHEEIFSSAHEVFKNPFISTLEEKLNAIEYLETLSTKESLSLLFDALNMIEIPLQSTRVVSSDEFELEDLPKGGIVSARAARAIFRHRSKKGIKKLEKISSDFSQHEYLREAIVYGLEDLVHPRVFNIFSNTLDDPSRIVRARTVRSIKNTVMKNRLVNSKEYQDMMGCLVEKVLEFDDDNLPLSKHSWHEAFQLLAYKLPDGAMNLLVDIVKTEKQPGRIVAAIEMLSNHKSQKVLDLFLGALKKKNHDKSVYEALHIALRRFRDRKVKIVASKILDESRIVKKMLSMLSSTYIEKLRVREKVAMSLLH